MLLRLSSMRISLTAVLVFHYCLLHLLFYFMLFWRPWFWRTDPFSLGSVPPSGGQFKCVATGRMATPPPQPGGQSMWHKKGNIYSAGQWTRIICCRRVMHHCVMQFYHRVTHHCIVLSIFYNYFTFRFDPAVLVKKKIKEEGITSTLLSGTRTQVPAAFLVLHKIFICMLHSQKILLSKIK